MGLDAGTVIRTGSAVLLLLLGLFVVVVGRRRMPNVLLGAFVIVSASTNIAGNLLRSVPAAQNLFVVLPMVAGLLAIATCLVVPQPATRRQTGGIVFAFALSPAIFFAGVPGGISSLDNTYALAGLQGAALVVGRVGAAIAVFGIAAGTLLLSWRAAASPQADGKGWSLWAVVSVAIPASLVFQVPTAFGHPLDGWTLLAVLLIVGGLVAAWLLATERGAGRIGLAMAMTWPALVLLRYLSLLAPGAGPQNFFDPWGLIGVLRVVGWALLVYAILRIDLLAVPLPHFAVSRGTVAAGALALLFIVAQIAQNFFSAEYGLLTGGIVAGAFLFAASPLQRAFERMGDRKAPPDALRPRDQSAEKLYRDALTFALRDGALSQDEDLHLADLGERLGISARRAREMRLDVERETGAE